MERELWMSLCGIMRLLDKPWGRWKYSASDILVMYFWGVVHDRPMLWSANVENWPEDILPKHFPSQSTLSRRMQKADVQQLMSDVETVWLSLTCTAVFCIRVIDAKGLTVGGTSKDADCGYGHCAGGMAKGYKLFTIWGKAPLPFAWGLARMNKSEKTMARALIPELPGVGYLLGDTEYDSNALFDLANEVDYQLVVRKRRKNSKGLGRRRQSPNRLRSIELLKQRFGKEIYGYRRQIERDYGNLTSFGGGLAPLPAWVRRFTRVRNWVHAKLLINAARWFRLNRPEVLALA